jgi:hypothetical protein
MHWIYVRKKKINKRNAYSVKAEGVCADPLRELG